MLCVLLALVKGSQKYYTDESNSGVQSWDDILDMAGMFAEIQFSNNIKDA